MKKLVLIALCLLPALYALSNGLAFSESQGDSAKLALLEPGKMIFDGDKPLVLGHTESPEVVDWNEDGKKDLLVGTFNEGKAVIFINEGSDKAPVFKGGTPVMVGGSPLKVGYG